MYSYKYLYSCFFFPPKVKCQMYMNDISSQTSANLHNQIHCIVSVSLWQQTHSNAAAALFMRLTYIGDETCVIISASNNVMSNISFVNNNKKNKFIIDEKI